MLLRAIELDATLAEAHAALGSIRQEQFRWSEAESAFNRAIALQPDFVRRTGLVEPFATPVAEDLRRELAAASCGRARCGLRSVKSPRQSA